MAGVLLGAPTRFECPNCTAQLELPRPPDRPVMHPCRGMKGLNVPMVSAGTKAKVEAVERGDYIGGERVQRDGEGLPVMSIVTTRDDGQDCAVLAPSAVPSRDEIEEAKTGGSYGYRNC